MVREREILWFGLVMLASLLVLVLVTWNGWFGGRKISIRSEVAGYKLKFEDKKKVENELTRLGAWQKNGIGFPKGNGQVERGEIRHLTVTLVGDKLPYGRSRYYGYNFGKEGRSGGRLEIWVDLSKPEMAETLVNRAFVSAMVEITRWAGYGETESALYQYPNLWEERWAKGQDEFLIKITRSND